MGWTSFEMKKGELKNWFINSWEYEGNFKVLDFALVHFRNAYGAIKNLKTGEVFATMYLVTWSPNSGYNFSVKEMDESVNPYYYDCPLRIMKLLTPTDHEYAIEWRKRVMAYHAKRKLLKSGVLYRTESPVNFGGYGSFCYFKIIGRHTFACDMFNDQLIQYSRVRFNPLTYGIGFEIISTNN